MIHTKITPALAKPISIEALAGNGQQKLFDITPVIHPQNGLHPDKSRTFWSATANAHYIVRRNGEDVFGATPDFAGKLADCPDLVAHGRRGPIGCDAPAIEGFDLWRAADAAALIDRPSQPVAFHAIGWLPTAMDGAGWTEMILQFLDEQIVTNGMIADWALHARADGEGGWTKKPHMHAVITSRFWKGPRAGQPQPAWFATTKMRNAAVDRWTTAVSVAK